MTVFPSACCYAARRFLVLAAFLADCDRSAAGLLAAAAPPSRPPLREGEWSSSVPRPEPLFFPAPAPPHPHILSPKERPINVAFANRTTIIAPRTVLHSYSHKW